MAFSHTFVLYLKLERLSLAKKILKGYVSSIRPRANPKEFPSTYSALVTIFHTLHSMTGSRRHRRIVLLVEVEGIPEELIQTGNEEQYVTKEKPKRTSPHTIKEVSW